MLSGRCARAGVFIQVDTGTVAVQIRIEAARLGAKSTVRMGEVGRMGGGGDGAGLGHEGSSWQRWVLPMPHPGDLTRGKDREAIKYVRARAVAEARAVDGRVSVWRRPHLYEGETRSAPTVCSDRRIARAVSYIRLVILGDGRFRGRPDFNSASLAGNGCPCRCSSCSTDS